MSNLIAQVKAAGTSELTDLAEQAGYRWPARGSRRGRKLHCASHIDRSPSVHLYQDRIYCFGCGESRDVVDLEQLVGGGTFTDAVLRLAARHGIAVESANAHVPVRPRFDAAIHGEAELFRTGLGWHLERELEASKLPLLEHGDLDADRILALTQLLTEIQSWTDFDAVKAFTDLKSKQPEWVAELVAEAEQAQALLMSILYFAGQSGEVSE